MPNLGCDPISECSLCYVLYPYIGLSPYYTIYIPSFSAQNKSRLKWCVFLHAVVFLAMLAKLTPEILDWMDVFVLELEELFVPKVNAKGRII